MHLKQATLIPGMFANKRPTDRFSKYKGQCRVCRTCGGSLLENENRAWSNEAPELCYCIKFDLCLDVDNRAGAMRLANGGGAVKCDGKSWSS
ncbi:hypothetical protein [Halodesulfovibrio aestuarii]|uniref:hypothetical protein n=1 Tax=Halodesulfovibrio aestuarii TaxID=126333 RepID=UPI003D3405CD